MKLSKTIRILIIVIIVLIAWAVWTKIFISIEPEREKVFSIWMPDKSDLVSEVQNVLKRGRRLGGAGGVGIIQIELTEEQFRERYPDYKFRWITINRDKKSKLIIMDYYGKGSLQATHIDHYEKSYKYKKAFYKFHDYTVEKEKQQLVVTLKKDWSVFGIFCMLIAIVIGYFGVLFLLLLPYTFS